MKWIANNIFSKLVLGAVAILAQLAWICYMVYRATAISKSFSLLFNILAVVLALYIINKDTRLYFKLSWVFFILCFPVAGCPCYFLFGRSDLTRKRRKRLAKVHEQISVHRQEDPKIKNQLKEDENAWHQSEYITKNGKYPIYQEKETTYYKSGEDMFPQFLEDLRSAKEYIFLEYFILAPGVMLDSIVDILEQKVKEGVHVRLLYDDVGSIKCLPNHYYRGLQEKGIHCALFHPFRPMMSIIMNNRDHRKICVVDGRIAYTGGVNLADEYINEIERFGYWKDEAIRVTGESAWGFAMMFMELWNYCVGGDEDCMKFCPKEYLPQSDADALEKENVDTVKVGTSADVVHIGGQEECNNESVKSDEKEANDSDKTKVCEQTAVVNNDKAFCNQAERGYVQPFSDSPLDHEYISENLYLNIINRANRYVYIFTPYLITSQEIATALITAAKSGVDVRIVTPEIPDKKLPYLLTQSNYEPLIKDGVKIYQYTPGFIHSKCILADDIYGVVGTINLDYRSLYLHFECGVYLYKAKALETLKEDMLETFDVSHEVVLKDHHGKNFFFQLFLSVLRLLAPLF